MTIGWSDSISSKFTSHFLDIDFIALIYCEFVTLHGCEQAVEDPEKQNKIKNKRGREQTLQWTSLGSNKY